MKCSGNPFLTAKKAREDHNFQWPTKNKPTNKPTNNKITDIIIYHKLMSRFTGNFALWHDCCTAQALLIKCCSLLHTKIMPVT